MRVALILRYSEVLYEYNSDDNVDNTFFTKQLFPILHRYVTTQLFLNHLGCSMASTVIQLYLKQVLEAFIHPHPPVRMNALAVVCLILKQGLVHPVQVSHRSLEFT